MQKGHRHNHPFCLKLQRKDKQIKTPHLQHNNNKTSSPVRPTEHVYVDQIIQVPKHTGSHSHTTGQGTNAGSGSLRWYMHTMALLEGELNTTSQHVTQKQEDQTEHLEKCDLSSGESREI